jgi:hypothetical protein
LNLSHRDSRGEWFDLYSGRQGELTFKSPCTNTEPREKEKESEKECLYLKNKVFYFYCPFVGTAYVGTPSRLLEKHSS